MAWAITKANRSRKNRSRNTTVHHLPRIKQQTITLATSNNQILIPWFPLNDKTLLNVSGDQSSRRRKWGEKKRGTPSGQTQIPQYAGVEEKVQAGPLLQSQVSHNAVIAGQHKKGHAVGRESKSFQGNTWENVKMPQHEGLVPFNIWK